MPGTAEAADNRPSSFDAKAYAPDAPGHGLVRVGDMRRAAAGWIPCRGSAGRITGS